MIIDAVIPLILEHGVGITSRQIAEAAGVAEGTVFRAFGDKESLIAAAADAFFERGASGESGPLIDASLDLEEVGDSRGCHAPPRAGRHENGDAHRPSRTDSERGAGSSASTGSSPMPSLPTPTA